MTVKLFYSVYQYLAKRKRFAVGIIAVLFLFLGWYASRIQFEEDITKLIPANEKSMQVQRVLENVNFADKIIIHLAVKDSGGVQDLTNYATAFLEQLNTTSKEHIKSIQGKLDNDQIFKAFDFAYNNIPVLLGEEDYQIIEQKLSPDSIKARTLSNYKTLISPSGFIAKETILKDPLGLTFLALKKLQQLNIGDDFNLKNGYLISEDDKHLLLFISPIHPSGETEKNTEFITQLDKVQTELNAIHQHKVEGSYFGAAPVAVANASQIKSDIQFTVGIAVSILLITLIVFYKRLLIPIILFVPTIFGALLAIAFLCVVREKVSAISLGIGSILLGVTLDYSLHILTHIRAGHQGKKLYQDICVPVLMCSITTAMAFLCLMFINSQALQDLGIFASISVLGSSAFALLFIPQVYTQRSSKAKSKTVLDTLASFEFHHNKWLKIALGILFVISLVSYSKVTFNSDLQSLNYMSEKLVKAQQDLEQVTNLTSKSIYLVAHSENQQEALQTNDAVYKKLQNLQAKNLIEDFSSIGALIQSKALQKKKIERWNSFWSPARVDTIVANLIKSGGELGFKENTFSSFYELLNKEFKTVGSSEFAALNPALFEDFITKKNTMYTVSTVVQLPNEQLEAVTDVFNDTPGILVVDRKQISESLLGGLKTDFNHLAQYSIVVVMVLLLLFYRSFSLALVTFASIILTWILTIGVMGLFHLEFNIFNIIISSFIFGLGIDYSIMITNGLLARYRDGTDELSSYRTSILLSMLTTMLGVGSLVFAKHPALYSISVVCIIGILFAVLLSFTIQPVLFKFFIGDQKNPPKPLRPFFHSVLSFGYFGIGGLILSVLSGTVFRILPISAKIKMKWFHRLVSKFMKSVLYTNGFVTKRVINLSNETFEKQAIIIANHTSFLDICAIAMLHPKIIFLVNDWVYHSPVFGKAVRMAGFYPVSSGLENGLDHIEKKIQQGYSIAIFPEGSRSRSNKIRRFHKGAFYLAEKFNLDIVPVLIHGNSEVLPKGSFVIQDGSIQLKILDRIAANDPTFSDSYSRRTRQITAHFRIEFEKFRNEIETSTYFHPKVKQAYRYKGDKVYHQVTQGLKVNSRIYSEIAKSIDKTARIIQATNSYGQLDYLLSLDASDRRIYVFTENQDTVDFLRNSYITKGAHKIQVNLNAATIPVEKADIVLIDYRVDPEFLTQALSKVPKVMLYGEALVLADEIAGKFKMEIIYDSVGVKLLKKQIYAESV